MSVSQQRPEPRILRQKAAISGRPAPARCPLAPAGVSAAVPTATARLKHSFEVDGASTVRITFEDTEVKLGGGLGGWLNAVPTLALPSLPEALRPPRGMRAATFDVTYLDPDMRITRGDRGEVRVFLKGMIA